MKRAFSGILAWIMLMLLLPAVPARADAQTRIRVLLGTEGASKVEISVKGTYTVGDTTFTDGSLTASINNGTITVSHSEKKILATGKDSIRVSRLEADPDAANLTLTNTGHNAKLVYLGDMVFHNANGTMEVINDVGLREYLYGAVSGELTDSSAKEVLKVGTICAKGFALAEVNARKSKSFDVYDTTVSQLYYGYKASDKNVIAAVDEVWQNTLVFGNTAVKTYYCTANGGQVLTPRIHWGGSSNDGAYYYGYDPFDLAANTKNVIADIDGKQPSAMQKKIYQYFLTLAEETMKEPVDSIEEILSLYGLYDPDHPDGTDRYPKDTAPHKESRITMLVRKKSGGTESVTCTFKLTELNEKAGWKASGKVAFTVRTGMQHWKLIYGISSGHRVGLSHRGAAQMAKEGYTYADILKFYYRGADLIDQEGNVIAAKSDFSFAYEGPDAEAPMQVTETPAPTDTPEPEKTPEETETPAPTDTPEPEKTPEETETPAPTDTPEPEQTPEETETPAPTDTPEPEKTPEETETPAPTDTPEPEKTAEETETPMPTNTPEPEEYKDPDGLSNGDVDGQNGITKADALLVIRYLVGLEELTERQMKRADINRDGIITASDASAILRMFLR